MNLLLQFFPSREDFVPRDVQLDHLIILSLFRAKACLVILLVDYFNLGSCVRSRFHLVPNVVVVLYNLGFPFRLFVLVGRPLGVDRIVVAPHELFVDVPLLLNLILVVIECCLVCSLLDWVVILEHSVVLLWDNIATVIERLHVT